MNASDSSKLYTSMGYRDRTDITGMDIRIQYKKDGCRI